MNKLSFFRQSLVLASIFLLPLQANALETLAKSAVLIEAKTGTILYDKDMDKPIPPASTSKLMTVYLVLEALKKGQLTEDTMITVSANARKQEGSRMFVNIGEQVRVIDLLHGAIIQSGNDACVALAEAVAGSVDEFAVMMNEKAAALGLKNSSFRNPTGLPDKEHYMSVHDLALLASHIMNDFPEYYKIYAEKEFTWNKIKQGNRNPLLYSYAGADGMKTGHTNEAGFNLVGSAVRNNMRLISVVSGLRSPNQRGSESRKLLDYGFGRFTMRQIGRKNFKVADLPIQLGEQDSVSAVLKDAVYFPVKRGSYDEPKTEIHYLHPLNAPIKAGDHIGDIVVTGASENPITLPLYAKQDIQKASFGKNILISLQDFFGSYKIKPLEGK